MAVFGGLIGLYFTYAVLNRQKAIATVKDAGVNLTSLGILGTFVGIAIGLFNFDTEAIHNSVRELLGGLKVAFVTSVFGLCAALVFRICCSPSVGAQGQAESAKDLLEKILRALSDEGDKSVAGQIQRLRASFGDLEKTNKAGFEKQAKEFNTFAKEISTKLSKSLMEELKNVIREFNDKITEQFGENFKKLNEAVGKLVTWQENYKQQMDVMKESMDASMSGIDKTQKSLKKIEQSAGQIPAHTAALAGLMEKMDIHLRDLEKNSSTFAEVHEKAVNVLPLIQQNMTDMTQGVKDVVEGQAKAQKQILDDMEKRITAAGGNVSKQMEAVGDTISQNIRRLDKAMQDEIGRTVQTMADQLGSIAAKFVSQYEPLMNVLKKVVESGRKASER